MKRWSPLAAVLALSLVSTPVAAHSSHAASPNLAPYADDSAALMQLSLKIQDWSDLLSLLPKGSLEEMSEMFQELFEELDEDVENVDTSDSDASLGDLGFDPFWDGLLNLGEHVSFSYRPNPGRAGDILANLDLRSGGRIQDVFKRLAQRFEAEGKTREFMREDFGGHSLYTFVLDEEDENYSQVSWAVYENQLMVDLGKDNRQLKNMLYRQAVLAEDSRFRLVNQAHFKPVNRSLKEQPLWFYADMQSAVKVFKAFLADEGESIEDLGVLDEVVPLMRGVGVGFDLQSDGLYARSFVAEDRMNLSAVQRSYLETFYAPKKHSLQLLLDSIPQSPLVFYGAHNMDVAFSHPYPLSLMAMGETEGMTAEMQGEIMSLMKEFTGIQPDRDLLPYMDGRLGFSVYQPEDPEASPQTLLYLGLSDEKAQEFEKNFTQNMSIDISELSGDDSAPLRFEVSEKYKGHQMYTLRGLPEMEELSFVQPVLARKGSLFVMAQTPDALKAVLDGKSDGGRLKSMARRLNPEEALGYFFMDFQKIMSAVQSALPEDEEIVQMAKAFEPFKSLYMSSEQQPGGTEGHFFFKVNFSEIDWATLAELFDDLGIEEELDEAILGLESAEAEPAS